MLSRRLKALNYPHGDTVDPQVLGPWLVEECSYPQDRELNPDKVIQYLDQRIRQKYCDNADELNKVPRHYSVAPTTDDPSFIDVLDVYTPECQQGIGELASALGMSQHSNPLITLEACCKLMIEDSYKLPSDNVIELNEHPMGVDVQDPVLKKAFQVFRLLHIHQLRDLQTVINKIIVNIQKITANPKTDTKLGKVGF